MDGLGVNWLAVGTLARFLCSSETLDPSGVTRVVANEADADVVAVLEDVEIGDESVVTHVAVGGRVVALSDLAQIFFEVGNGVFEAGHLSGVLRGPGLDSECKTVNELMELRSRDVRMGVEGSQDSARGQGGDFGDRGPSWRGG